MTYREYIKRDLVEFFQVRMFSLVIQADEIADYVPHSAIDLGKLDFLFCFNPDVRSFYCAANFWADIHTTGIYTHGSDIIVVEAQLDMILKNGEVDEIRSTVYNPQEEKKQEGAA